MVASETFFGARTIRLASGAICKASVLRFDRMICLMSPLSIGASPPQSPDIISWQAQLSKVVLFTNDMPLLPFNVDAIFSILQSNN